MSAPHATAGLAAFGADALDWPALRAALERHAPTALGLRALRELAPRDDAGARAALARVEELLACEARGDLPGLAGVGDVLPALHAARSWQRPLDKPELAAVAAFLEAAARVATWMLDQAPDRPQLARLGVGMPVARRLREALERALDHRGELRDEASPTLARLRGEAGRLGEAIQGRLAQLAGSPALRGLLSDGAVHRRGGRGVLAVRAKSAGRVPGLVHERSHSGETVFVEPRETLELGNRLAEVEHDLRNEEQRLLVELSRLALASEEELAEASARLGELELGLVALRLCSESGARVPRVPGGEPREAGSRGLVLRQARHPLLVEEQRRGALERVVPIDVRLGDDFDMLVITGPNTGGKTLALKTVGVAGLCVRLGLPVCCGEGSSVPLYDGIAADIGDRQEISQSLSTFASHLVRIRAGLERATPRTLLLLDELGGGTDPDEGAALGDALLEHLLERRVPTLVTTHIGKLKEFAFRNPRAENASVAFDADTLRPLYHLLVGTPGESNALHIAQHLGLDPALVERARLRLERRDREVLELMADVRGAREHAERLRSAAEDRLEDAERTRADVREREAELARRGSRLEAEAQRLLEERLAAARRRVQEARGLLGQLPAAQAKALGALLDGLDQDLAEGGLTERRRAFLDGLAKGQFVWLPRYRKRALVARVDRARGELTVQMGRMSVRVPLDEVSAPDGV